LCRKVDVAGAAFPMQKIETVDMPRSEALAGGQTTWGELQTTVREDFTMHLLNPENDTSVNLIKSDIILQ
jgi:hypothetical protein